MERILIIEDDKVLSNELRILLSNNGYDAYELFDYKNTIPKILEFKPDLVLLDIILPESNGQSILRGIRRESNVPVIMLTSKNTDVDEIMSLSCGADDYITKPYNPTLLLLRIESLLKRVSGNNNEEELSYRGITINLLRSSLQYNSQEIILSKNELTILYYLMKNKGIIVSRDALMDYLWDFNDFVDDNTLTVNINRLRRRLSDIGLEDAIETRRKQGYILI